MDMTMAMAKTTLHLHLRHTILMLMVQKISTILRWTRQRVASWLELEPESIFKVLLRVQLGMEPYADFLFLLVVTTLCAGIVQGVEAQSVLIITNAFLRMLEYATDAKGIVAATARQMGHNSVVKCIGMVIVFGIGRRRETTSTFIKLGWDSHRADERALQAHSYRLSYIKTKRHYWTTIHTTTHILPFMFSSSIVVGVGVGVRLTSLSLSHSHRSRRGVIL